MGGGSLAIPSIRQDWTDGMPCTHLDVSSVQGFAPPTCRMPPGQSSGHPYSQNTKVELRSIRYLCEDLLALALEHPLDCLSIAACPCAFSKHHPPENYIIGALSDSLDLMAGSVLRWLSGVRMRLRQRRDLLLEFIVLHHQLAVLQRTGTRRPCFRRSERLFWVFLSQGDIAGSDGKDVMPGKVRIEHRCDAR
jgi:hypothetical protein